MKTKSVDKEWFFYMMQVLSLRATYFDWEMKRNILDCFLDFVVVFLVTLIVTIVVIAQFL